MDGTINLDPIIRQIEGHRDREINKILAQTRGQFHSGYFRRVLGEFTGELSQKAGDFAKARLTVDEIRVGLDATVQRALLLLSNEFEKRDARDKPAYLNEKARWESELEETRDALVERCKMSLARDVEVLGRSEANPPIQQTAEDQSRQHSGLHPWGVITALTFGLPSDEIVEIMSFAGLQVDWSLNEKESYSHGTRKRVYRPRVDAAFSELNDSEKLRVAWVVSSEVTRRYPDKVDDLRSRLAGIGWTLDGGAIRPASGQVEELFFPRGSEHDAYIRLREIIQVAKRKVSVVDPYLDSAILTLLSTTEKQVDIELLSSSLPVDFLHEVEVFRKQHKPKSLEVRRTREFHDRFIIIDETKCFHVGASIKDAGARAFMISEVQDEGNIHALLEQFSRSWSTATPLRASA